MNGLRQPEREPEGPRGLGGPRRDERPGQLVADPFTVTDLASTWDRACSRIEG
jgi:hypothetical protein